MGARLQGDNITFQDNTITHPVFGGDDTDGMRFFGDDITILHNTISDVSDGSDCNDDGCGDGPHPDCMQTFYSDQLPDQQQHHDRGQPLRERRPRSA